MWRELGLRGADLLVFARVYGFCKNGGLFYESRAKTAAYLGLSERSIIRAIGGLVERGLLIDLDPTTSLDGVSTRTYALDECATNLVSYQPSDKTSPPDKVASKAARTDEAMSGERVPDWHLKSKSESNL